MTQTTGKFFDELGKLITDAAGAAQLCGGNALRVFRPRLNAGSNPVPPRAAGATRAA